MPDRSADWLRQAEADLEHAELSLREGDYEWSSFAAQQAAEKAIKAVYYSHHGDPWGHSLLALMRGLPGGTGQGLHPIAVPQRVPRAHLSIISPNATHSSR